jgi:ribonuclease E
MAEPAIPAIASLVTADAATAEAQSEERRGRKRRRRRGRGGRGAEGDSASGTDKSAEAGELADEDADQVEPTPAGIAVADVPTPAPEVESSAEPVTSQVDAGQVAKPRAVTVTTPSMIVVPTTYSLPEVSPAPMPIEQLQAVLQLAGLSLVQTEPGKFSETQARLAAEPRPVRVPRERPQLPPLDDRPLIQVETRPGQSPSA